MLSKNLNVGQVVESSCGRDEGLIFFTIEIVDKDYVLICDGKNRKIDKPKKKKIKHLNISNYVDEEVRQLLCNKEDLTDSFIRARLYKLKNT